MKNPRFASMEAVQDANDGAYQLLVWPDEGSFDDAGNWHFNDAHHDFEPLMLDMTTASAIIAVFKVLNSANSEKVTRMVGRSRAHFAKVVEVVWGAVSPADG